MSKLFGLFIWINDHPKTGNVLNLTNIIEPRKAVDDYKEGDEVIVKCPGHGKQHAVIGKITGEEQKKSMGNILRGYEFKNLVDKFCPTQEKEQEIPAEIENTMPVLVKPKAKRKNTEDRVSKQDNGKLKKTTHSNDKGNKELERLAKENAAKSILALRNADSVLDVEKEQSLSPEQVSSEQNTTKQTDTTFAMPSNSSEQTATTHTGITFATPPSPIHSLQQGQHGTSSLTPPAPQQDTLREQTDSSFLTQHKHTNSSRLYTDHNQPPGNIYACENTTPYMEVENTNLFKPSPSYNPLPVHSYNDNHTSDMMGTAYRTLYGTYDHTVSSPYTCTTPQNKSSCHDCCNTVKDLQQRVIQLECIIQQLQKSKKEKLAGTDGEKTKKNEELLLNGKSLEELTRHAELTKNLSEGVSLLLQMTFTLEELTTSSVMGVSNKKGNRPGLDQYRRSAVEAILMKKFDTTITSIRNCMRDRLKLLRIKYSGTRESLATVDVANKE